MRVAFHIANLDCHSLKFHYQQARYHPRLSSSQTLDSLIHPNGQFYRHLFGFSSKFSLASQRLDDYLAMEERKVPYCAQTAP